MLSFKKPVGFYRLYEREVQELLRTLRVNDKTSVVATEADPKLQRKIRHALSREKSIQENGASKTKFVFAYDEETQILQVRLIQVVLFHKAYKQLRSEMEI